MYDYELIDELIDFESDLEARELIRDHSPRFWDVDAAEEIGSDPWEHPSWDYDVDAGWDDPAEAANRVLFASVIADARLSPSTPSSPVLSVVDDYDVAGLWMSRGWAA